MKNLLKPSNLFLVLANIVPLLGVLFWGWDAKGVFVVYILETVLIGALNVLKMLVVYILNGTRNEPPPSPGDNVGGFFIIPFFIFHYYFFVFVQSVLYFAFSSIGDHSIREPYMLIRNFSPYLIGETKYAMLSLLAANLTYFIDGFVLSGQYKKETLSGLMFQPYKRIFLQQAVVILGGFISMMFGSAAAVAVFFILLKTAADYLSANYTSNPKIQNWVKENLKSVDEDKKELTKEQKEAIERIFSDKK